MSLETIWVDGEETEKCLPSHKTVKEKLAAVRHFVENVQVRPYHVLAQVTPVLFSSVAISTRSYRLYFN